MLAFGVVCAAEGWHYLSDCHGPQWNMGRPAGHGRHGNVSVHIRRVRRRIGRRRTLKRAAWLDAVTKSWSAIGWTDTSGNGRMFPVSLRWLLTLWRPLVIWVQLWSFLCQTGLRQLFVVFDIRALWAMCQSARMSKITNDCLTWSGTGCFIAVPIWQQWASKG